MTCSSECGCSCEDSCCSESSCSEENSCNEVDCLCKVRERTYKGCVCYNSIKAYSIDTCNIKYRLRTLRVPSDKYCTLDDAWDCIEDNEGGHNIYLKPGCVFELNKSHVQGTTVNIYGDRSDLVGRAFIQSPKNDFYVYKDQYYITGKFGTPPYNIIVNGRKLIVEGQINPDFSCMCPGRKVGFVLCDGTIKDNKIKFTDKNSITFEGNIPLSNPVIPGEGFFIYPNVTVVVGGDLLIGPFTTLRIEGVHFVGSTLSIGRIFTTTLLRFCVFSNKITMNSGWGLEAPNVYLHQVTLETSSYGYGVNQCFVGYHSTIFNNGATSSPLYDSIFASCNRAIALQNGGRMDLFSSTFVNNFIAVDCHTGAKVDIEGVMFSNNKIALICFDHTLANSYSIGKDFETTQITIFQDNFITIDVGYSSAVIIPKAIVHSTRIPFILDGIGLTTVESLPLGAIGNKGSRIEVTINPIDIDSAKTSTTELANVLTAMNNLSAKYHGLFGISGIGTHSAITKALAGETPVKVEQTCTNNCLGCLNALTAPTTVTLLRP